MGRLPSQSSALSDHVHALAQPGSVDTDAIVDEAVTTDKLADSAVTEDAIAAGAVTVAKLAAAVVDLLVPTGTLAGFVSETPPGGWLVCDGTAVSRATYAGLYAVIGDSFGAGDGSTTFNVPDLQGRFPLGLATSGIGSTLGGTGGTIDHVHDLNTATSAARIGVGVGAPGIIGFRRKTGLTAKARTQSTPVTVNNDTANDTTGVELDGSSDTGNPPFQAVVYIVKT